MADPIFWLGLSFLLVALCLTAVLLVAIPALQELGRAARSAEKLFDTLYRELPPTLEAIRLTGLEITDLTEDLDEGVKRAGHWVKEVDRSVQRTQRQVRGWHGSARGVVIGVKAAWKTWQRYPQAHRHRSRSRNSPSGSSPPNDAI